MGGKQVMGPRMTAEVEGDFVVFVTGMRINKYWKVHKWWPNFRAMRKTLMALFSSEEFGAMGAHAWWNSRGPLLIGYFRSVEALERFANDPEQPHAQAWRDYFRRLKNNPDVGVWHETYVVRSGEYEAVYDYMPSPTGLSGAGFGGHVACVPVERRGHFAHQRRAHGARLAAEAAAREDAARKASGQNDDAQPTPVPLKGHR